MDEITFDTELTTPDALLLNENIKREILRDIEKGIYTKTEKEKYIVQNSKMKEEDYNAMIKEAVFTAYANKMIKMNFNRPFGVASTISSDNSELRKFQRNFDGYNNDLTTFGRRGFKRSMYDSQVQVFIDYNNKKKRATSTIILPENILGFFYDDNNELVHLRFMTNFSTKDPNANFKRLNLRKVWIFDKDDNGNVVFSLYTEDKNNVGSFLKTHYNEKYTKNFIPLFSFYPDSTEAPFAPDLIFRDLAEKNIEYFRSQTLQVRYLAQGRIPILLVTGVEEGTKGISIGKSLALLASDPQADMKYIEISGKSLEAGDRYNAQLVTEMSQLGVELLNKKVNISATGAAIDNAQNLSLLTAYAIQYESFLKKLVNVMHFWTEITDLEDLEEKLNVADEDGDKDNKFVLNIDTDFSTIIEQAELQFLQNMRATGDISGKTITNYAKNKGILPAEYDYEEDQESMLEMGFMPVDNSVLVDNTDGMDNKLKQDNIDNVATKQSE